MTGLVEREGLLARLEEDRRHGGRLVLVGGEAGVGKTVLVRAFAASTRARVLLGACENLTTPTPLGPFGDVAAQVGGSLAELLSSDADPRDVARAVLQELDSSTVVVLEDVHWADGATLDALRVLGRRVDASAGLVLATYRDDEVAGDHPLRAVLGELASVMAGEIDRGIEYLLRSLEVARADDIEFRISSALGMLGSGLGEMYELERSERYLREQIAFAEERDLWPMYQRSWLALVDVYRGRWDDGAARAANERWRFSSASWPPGNDSSRASSSASAAPGSPRRARTRPSATRALIRLIASDDWAST